MTNLKYEFIDAAHKRMHNALIAAGWSCENDVYPPCSGIKFNWVYSTTDEDIYFNKEKTLNHRNKYFYPLRFYNKTFSEVADILEQEIMKDKLKDKQPAETHEEVEYQSITKDNIVEVLNYNKSLGLKIDSIKKTDDYICYRQFINGKWENEGGDLLLIG